MSDSSDDDTPFVPGGPMVTPGDFAQTDDDDDDTDEKQDTPAVTKKRSGHNTSNAAKHSKLIGEISELMEKHYVFNEHEGDPYAAGACDEPDKDKHAHQP